jgi:hypothetical protein
MSGGTRERAFVEGERCSLVCYLLQRELGGCTPSHASVSKEKYSADTMRLTLLFEYRSFTPRPVLEWVMVLYSPSSSSLRA